MADDEQRVTIMREYRSPAEYRREVARLCRAGWEVESVLDRAPRPGRLERLTLGLSTLFAEPGREFLVAYTWRRMPGRPAPRVPTRPARAARALAAARRWWWAGAAAALVVVLAQGIAGFLGAG